MNKEIVLNKKYKNLGSKERLTYTALHTHKGTLFYFWESLTMSGHSCMDTKVFMDCVEEIPEAPEEWFEVIYKVGNGRPTKASNLYKSKEDFFEKGKNDAEILLMTKVEL